jgi:hypothetical protein
MRIEITSYKVSPRRAVVDVEFNVILPTGGIVQSIAATEATLTAAALARGAEVWSDPDLATVVASAFRTLSDHVTVQVPGSGD